MRWSEVLEARARVKAAHNDNGALGRRVYIYCPSGNKRVALEACRRLCVRTGHECYGCDTWQELAPRASLNPAEAKSNAERARDGGGRGSAPMVRAL